MDATHGHAPDRLERVVSGVAIGVAVTLWAAHAVWLLGSLALADVPRAIVAVGLAALLADLVTGVVHWACDTWGDEETPWIGPTLIYAFRDHHERPCEMLERPWTSVNRETGAVAALVGVAISFPAAQAWLAQHVVSYAFLLSLVVYGAGANQLHCWAHDPRPPRLVRRAQRLGLVLSPEHHGRHHRRPNTTAYCISTGWFNPLLDRLDFWRRLERLVSRLTGLAAREGQAPRRIGSS